MENFKKYFKFPLKQDVHAPFIVWTSDNGRAFDFKIESEELQKKIVNTINSKTKQSLMVNNLAHKDGDVFTTTNGSKLLTIRG